MNFFWISSMGLLGILTRYFLGLIIQKNFSGLFPLGTFLINLSGSFSMGVAYVLGVEKLALSPEVKLGIMVGFLGGYTTFSSYCLEAITLIEKKEYFCALSYVFLSPVLGLFFTFLGIFFIRKISL